MYGEKISVILGYHLNPMSCGIAKFNTMLAKRLGVPHLHVFVENNSHTNCPLLSIKVSEFQEDDKSRLRQYVGNIGRGHYKLFLHEYSNTDLEKDLIERAAAVFCANMEIFDQLGELHSNIIQVWCPGMIEGAVEFRNTDLSVFTFGMAHKISRGNYLKLKKLLENTGQSYAVYMSTAVHEGENYEHSAQQVNDHFSKLFGNRFYFLGNLSDSGIQHYMNRTTFFAAFFDRGVRANNTSVNAALQHGCVVITNLDEYSPAGFVHGENLLDINQCVQIPGDSAYLSHIGANARILADRYNWETLVLKFLEM